MDKTLEIVMVAVALIVAVVIVTALLGGRADMFGAFADNQTSQSNCGIGATQLKTAANCSCGSGGCSGTDCSSFDGRANDICNDYSSCGFGKKGICG